MEKSKTSVYKKSCKLKGISLLETIMIVGIVSLLSFMIILNFNLFNNRLEKLELTQIKQNIYFIRSSSISSRTKETIFFDFQDNSYTFSNSDDKVELKYLDLDESSSNRKEFYFTEKGTPGFEGAGTITLLGQDKIYKISVTPVTGKVNIKIENEKN